MNKPLKNKKSYEKKCNENLDCNKICINESCLIGCILDKAICLKKYKKNKKNL